MADELAEKFGLKVLSIAPCIFNPIEHIWGIAKNYYNRHIGRDGRSVDNSLTMWREALTCATP